MTDHSSDEVLWELAEGLAAVVDPHVDSCPECQGRVTAYQQAQAYLQEASPLTRRFCPPPAELLDSQDARLEAHVLNCPACREDRRDWEVLAAPELLGAVGAKLRLLLELPGRALRLLESSWPEGPTPALAPARGQGKGGQPVVIQAPFPPGHLELSWLGAEGGADLRLSSQSGAPSIYRVCLGQGEEVWESRSSDSSGRVTFQALSPGSYRLAVFSMQSATPQLELELSLELA